MKHKYLHLGLVITLIISLVTPVTELFASGGCSYKGKLPVGYPACSDNGFPFNAKYYYGPWNVSTGVESDGVISSPNLVVYGDPSDIDSNIQDFEKGYLPDTLDPTNVLDNHGRFKDGSGHWGEFRFLGVAQDGSPYFNIHYPNDVTTTKSLEKKKWLYQPWAYIPSGYVYKPINQGDFYKEDNGQFGNVMGGKFDAITESLTSSIPFNILNPTKYVSSTGTYNPVANNEENYDLRNYVRINQAPDAIIPGNGTMFHYSDYSKRIWYQTFPLEPVSNPEQTPITPEMVVKDAQPIRLDSSEYATVKSVVIRAKIEDDEYYGTEYGEAIHETRKNVLDWGFKLYDEKSGTYIGKKLSAKQVTISGNMARSEYVNVKIPKSLLNEVSRTGNKIKYTYKLQGKVDAFMRGTIKMANVYADVTFQSGPIETKELMSLFTNNPSVTFQNTSEVGAVDLSYFDASVGDIIEHYQISVKDKSTGTTQTFDYNNTTPQSINNDAISSTLINHMKSKFPSTPTGYKSIQFQIAQTVFNSDRTKSHVYKQDFSMSQLSVPPPPPPQYTSVDFIIPERWYDIVKFPAVDLTPDPPGGSIVSRSCSIDGQSIDANEFWSGNYIFGDEEDGLHQISCNWTAEDGTISSMIKHTVIYDTKPQVALDIKGLFKQNRTMVVDNISEASNSKFVTDLYPITYTFEFVSDDDSSLRKRIDTNMQKLFMYKTSGTYKISIKGVNELGRVSDPYVLDFEIHPDYSPSIIAQAIQTQTSRVGNLDLHYDVQSTDGDQIAVKEMKVFYDSKNDNSFDTLMGTYTGDITSLPQMSKVGQYKIVTNAKESTTQDRLMEFITPADDMEKTAETFFFVDNYSPTSMLYWDQPIERPDVDVYFMLDSNLQQTSTDYVRGNSVSLTNEMNNKNMDGKVDFWDMKTYTYSQSASISSNTGSSYPSGSIYYESNGYSGTLPRTSVTNAQYQEDIGTDKQVTDSKTATDSCSNTVTTSYDSKGHATGSTSWDSCPSSKSYSDGSYSGTLSGGSATSSGSCPSDGGPKNGSCSVNWTKSYSGTVYWTHMVHEPNWVWRDNYTGHYSGSIYKDVRQSMDVGFFRTSSIKYLIYISDGTVSQLTDLRNVIAKNDVKVILIGQAGIQAQVNPHEQFILSNNAAENLISDALDYIALNNPEIPKISVLIGESTTTIAATLDIEGDPMLAGSDQMKIVQDVTGFDNPMGYATIGGKVMSNDEVATTWTTFNGNITFPKVGTYTLIRRVKDIPDVNPLFIDYAYFSNEARVKIKVQRKPIADYVLDFDYNISSNTYYTSWIDTSYDLDHNITRAATDRGIAIRTMKFMNTATNETFTAVPSELSPGTYNVKYKVKDIDGAWSDEISRNYTLPAIPPMQLRADLKPQDSFFTLASVPASESAISFNVWTRYPYSVDLQHYAASVFSRNVNYYTGTKTNNDIRWNDELFTIPATTPDGNYSYRITASGSGGESTYKDIPFKVVTPINLSAGFSYNGSTTPVEIVTNESITLTADTTEYPHQTIVIAFKGTGYQRTVTLVGTVGSTSGIGDKAWTGTLAVPLMPDGNYVFEWRSVTPNGNSETVTKTIKIVNNRPPVANFDWSPKPVYEGDVISLINLQILMVML